jgi:uncharacterized protein (TIGR02145 family)/uncharacterized repeat protein (TIGR02543 family)
MKKSPLILAAPLLAYCALFIGCNNNSVGNNKNGNGDVNSTDSVGYTITFNANGGTVSPASAKTDADGKLASLPTPTKSSYIFDGWYTAATGGFEATTSATFRENMTIYAHWRGLPTPTVTTFTDERDGNIYKKLKIGTQIWMGENLNYAADGSVCYQNSADSCAKYGRMYDWGTAKTVCPTLWHLPSDAEWTQLTDFIGDSSTAGKALKSTSGWYNNGNNNGNGTDEYGFAALPGGIVYDDGNLGEFCCTGIGGFWWSATEGEISIAWSRIIYNTEGAVQRIDEGSAINMFSVRCVQD